MTEEEKQKKIDDDYNEMMRNVAINAIFARRERYKTTIEDDEPYYCF